MYRLWEILKNRTEPPTATELQLAAGKITLTDPGLTSLFKDLEDGANPLPDGFARQEEKAIVCPTTKFIQLEY
jgi:hypothetical protein